MNWFNLKDLEKRLQNNEVSEREGFKYLLVIFILFILSSYGDNTSYSLLIFGVSDLVLTSSVTIAGIWLTFKTNQSYDNQHYFIRFFSLYFVLGIRLAVFLLILIPVFLLLNKVFGPLPENGVAEDAFFLTFITSFNILFYYLLVKSFQRVAQNSVSHSLPTQ